MKTPTTENRQTKQKAKSAKKPQRKLTDLPAKKDVRGGEDISLNYSKIHYHYNP
jgi:hypothetical protein